MNPRQLSLVYFIIFLYLTCEGIESQFKQTRRLLCAWHIQRNLQAHFRSLSGKETKELYDKIICLPFITRIEKFNKIVSEVKNSEKLSSNQIQYLESPIKIKIALGKK